MMPLPFIVSILLWAISCAPVFTQAELTFKHWSFNTSFEKNGNKKLYKNAKGDEKNAGNMYFYSSFGYDRKKVLPGYDGNHLASIFVPIFHGKKHHVWLDTGLLPLDFGVGYRNVLNWSHLNQDWFWGVYFITKYHGQYKINHSLKKFQRTMLGVEIGASRWGQLTGSLYGIFEKALNSDKSCNELKIYHLATEKFHTADLLDNVAGSVKWVSVPNVWGVQMHTAFSCAQIQKRKSEGERKYYSENVWNLSTGFEFNIRSWAHVELQWTLLDKYNTPSIIPSINFKFLGAKPYLASDKFQGRLRRPPQNHAPLYADFGLDDYFSWFDEPSEEDRSLPASTVNRRAVNRRSAMYTRGYMFVPGLRAGGVVGENSNDSQGAPPPYSEACGPEEQVLDGNMG